MRGFPSVLRFLRGGVPALVLLSGGCTDVPRESAPASAPESAEPSAGVRVTGKAPPALGGHSAVVMLEPLDGSAPGALEGTKYMDQLGSTFHPKVLVVGAGAVVEFINSEDVFHNVRAVDGESGETEFNVASPPFVSYPHTFAEPGVFDLGCDIHPAMAAFIVVSSTPFAVVADEDGFFALADVPPGSYKLTVWHLEAEQRSEREVQIGGDGGEVRLDLSP